MKENDRLGSSVDRAVGFEPTSVAGSTPAQVTKFCKDCNRDLDAKHFGVKNQKTGALQVYCKPCQAARSAAHYAANQQTYVARNHRRMRENVAFLEQFKSRPCEDCGNIYPSKVMDMHHRESEDKEALISQLVRKTTLPRLKRELEKCDLLCANCHRLRTFYSGVRISHGVLDSPVHLC